MNSRIIHLDQFLHVRNISFDKNLKNPKCPCYFLCLYGTLHHYNKEYHIKVTESKKHGPLFLNKGKDGIFFYNDGAVRRLLDKLNFCGPGQLLGSKLPVVTSRKGFWVVDIDKIIQHRQLKQPEILNN